MTEQQLFQARCQLAERGICADELTDEQVQSYATNNAIAWIVKRHDGCMLARNGRWYHMVAGVEDIKTYSSNARASRYGMSRIRSTGQDGLIGTLVPLYLGDIIDVCGNIERAN